MLTSVRLDEKSSAACALTSWRDRIHLLWAGPGAELNLAFAPDGLTFAAPQQLPHRTYSYDDSSMDDNQGGPTRFAEVGESPLRYRYRVRAEALPAT